MSLHPTVYEKGNIEIVQGRYRNAMAVVFAYKKDFSGDGASLRIQFKQGCS